MHTSVSQETKQENLSSWTKEIYQSCLSMISYSAWILKIALKKHNLAWQKLLYNNPKSTSRLISFFTFNFQSKQKRSEAHINLGAAVAGTGAQCIGAQIMVAGTTHVDGADLVLHTTSVQWLKNRARRR
jgi:hypothetical protein